MARQGGIYSQQSNELTQVKRTPWGWQASHWSHRYKHLHNTVTLRMVRQGLLQQHGQTATLTAARSGRDTNHRHSQAHADTPTDTARPRLDWLLNSTHQHIQILTYHKQSPQTLLIIVRQLLFITGRSAHKSGTRGAIPHTIASSSPTLAKCSGSS